MEISYKYYDMSNKKLYPYQKEIVRKTIETDEHVIIQLPTGGGKTFIAAEIIKKLTNLFGDFKQVLFVAPKIILMKQAVKKFLFIHIELPTSQTSGIS